MQEFLRPPVPQPSWVMSTATGHPHPYRHTPDGTNSFPLTLDVSTCTTAANLGLPAARFKGTYRPQSLNPNIPDSQEQGTFQVEVFDQGEPGRSMAEITGDSFSIQLQGGTYHGYTRAGYVEGGNIQVQ